MQIAPRRLLAGSSPRRRGEGTRRATRRGRRRRMQTTRACDFGCSPFPTLRPCGNRPAHPWSRRVDTADIRRTHPGTKSGDDLRRKSSARWGMCNIQPCSRRRPCRMPYPQRGDAPTLFPFFLQPDAKRTPLVNLLCFFFLCIVSIIAPFSPSTRPP